MALTAFDQFGQGRTLHPHGRVALSTGTGQLVANRNTIARVTCDESVAEWVLIVDTDSGFDPDTLERLIAVAHPVDRPIVGALSFGVKTAARAAHGGTRQIAYPTLMMWYELEDRVGFAPAKEWPRDDLMVVSGTGCHCLLVHRTVFERIRAKYAAEFAAGHEWFTPITHPKGPTTFSEDLSFCLRAAACDIPVHVHTGIKTTHDKGFAFLDEEFYIHQEIAAGRLVPREEEAECPQPASA